MEKQEVVNALRDTDKTRCLETLHVLSQKKAAATAAALLEALEGTDKQLRSRSAWALALLPLHESPAVMDALASHLQNDPDAAIRLCCAVGLMSQVELRPHDAPEKEGTASMHICDAYIHAVTDQDERVALIALGQLGFHGGAKATATLFNTLSHPSWRLRLEACKSSITLQAADHRVVAALEQLAQEPEAKTYDAKIEEMEVSLRQAREAMPDDPEVEELSTGMWGTVTEILGQAQTLATR